MLIILQRFRSSFFLCSLVIVLLIINISIHSQREEDIDFNFQNKDIRQQFSASKALRMLRLAFFKWWSCMRDTLDGEHLSLDDMDPQDPQFSYLQWLVSQEAEEKKKVDDNEKIKKIEELWNQIVSHTDLCRSRTDMWHMEPETVKGTALKFFRPSSLNTSATFVRIGIGANVSIENYFKNVLPPSSEFYGADPVFSENYELYSPIGTFFPFAIGNETGWKPMKLTTSSDQVSQMHVNHIGIDVFFKDLIRKDVIDYLIIEGDSGESDIMAHLAKNGTLEKAGIAVCQINIEYHFSQEVKDPRREVFRKHILQFIRDQKYTLLFVTDEGDLKLFWVNTSSLECARRYLERLFLNDADLLT